MAPPDRQASPSTREHILDSAVSVMRNLGLGRATTKEIAQAAGLSEAALYRHFADKAELFLCVIGERLPQLFGLLQDLPGRAGQRTVRANLEEIVRTALPFFEQTLPIATALFAEPELLARHQAELRARDAGPHRANEMLATYIRAEQRLGRLNRRIDPEATAAVILGTSLGRAMARRFTGEPAPPHNDEQFVRAVVRTLLIGLAPGDEP